MIRNSIRSYSAKAIPYLSLTPNKFNSARSTWNLKPALPQGLVHNPPASVPNASKTPKAFLPTQDPRSTRLSHKSYTREQVDDMPVVYASSANPDYSVTPEIVSEIQSLRDSNPQEWTVNKLARKFQVSPAFVKVTTSINQVRKETLAQQEEAQKQQWPLQKQKARIDRKRRVELWLRNEF